MLETTTLLNLTGPISQFYFSNPASAHPFNDTWVCPVLDCFPEFLVPASGHELKLVPVGLASPDAFVIRYSFRSEMLTAFDKPVNNGLMVFTCLTRLGFGNFNVTKYNRSLVYIYFLSEPAAKFYRKLWWWWMMIHLVYGGWIQTLNRTKKLSPTTITRPRLPPLLDEKSSPQIVLF